MRMSHLLRSTLSVHCNTPQRSHLSILNIDSDSEPGGCIQPDLSPPARVRTLTMNSQVLWHETKLSPRKAAPPPWYNTWLKLLSERRTKHISPSQGKHNEMRKRKLTTRQLERIRVMSGAFDDEEVDEKVALGDSMMLMVERGDVLVGQGGKYLHPRLFRVI